MWIRPWVIPIGLDLHVINPTSNQTQCIGYWRAVWRRLWVSGLKNIQSGLDDLFHLASNQTNTVNDFGTIGLYDSGEARHTALFNPPRLRTRRLHCTMQFQHYW